MVPNFDPVWVLPAAFIAGFAVGYGARSLVSYGRRRRALLPRFGGFISDRLQFEAKHYLSIVPRDDVGDLQSPAAAPTNRGGNDLGDQAKGPSRL